MVIGIKAIRVGRFRLTGARIAAPRRKMRGTAALPGGYHRAEGGGERAGAQGEASIKSAIRK